MSNNYSEQIFQSIDTIISQRLNEVSFDKTEICEIVSQDKDNVNRYWVSNGSLKYEAYSIDENRKYLANQKVYVTIPQGNYDLRKLIIGSYSADETNENLYVNPFNHLITSSSHKLSDIIITTNTLGNSTSDFKDLNIRFNYSNTINFDYIGLEFSLDTSSLQGTYKGTYSIELQIYNNEDEQLNTSRIILYNTDLYGNPYSLIPMLKFQHLFPFPKEIKKITDIAKIRVLLAQDGNFERIGDIKLYFGYDTKTITKDELQLMLEEGQSLKYTTGETATARTLYLDWKHFDTSNTPYIFNINQLPNIFEYYKVYWLHYVDGLGKNSNLPDEYAWNWETITNNINLTQGITLTTLYRTDQYKVVIEYKYKNNETIYYAESTGLVFDNTDVAADPGASNSSEDSLRIKLNEGDTGIYNVYGLDGRMMDYSYKGPHNIHFEFLDTTPLDRIASINWEFPSENTMIKDVVDIDKQQATFNIDTMYKPGAMNNRIWCTVTLVTGEIRRGSLTLQFGEAAAAGSNYAFNIDFIGHRTCLYASGKEDSVEIQAIFTKQNGEVMTVPTITWSWMNDYDSPITLSSSTGEKITLKYNNSEVPKENYSILQAKINDYAIDNGLTTNLTAYLPIPIAKPEYNYISGATRVVYDSNGNTATYSKNPYELYNLTNKIENTSWDIISNSTNDTFQLKTQNIRDKNGNIIGEEKTLLPLSYIPQKPPMTCIYCILNGNIVWSQPILIMQNRWDYDLLNEWNGKLNINDQQGYILAPLLGAGKKEDNGFTGVIMGDLKFASGSVTNTGLYGFKEGSRRFSFNDKGEAYIGTGDYYIDFNGEDLTIKAKNFDLNANNGALVINDREGIKLGEKISINPDGTAKIGGWNINSSTIYSDTNQWYIQLNSPSAYGDQGVANSQVLQIYDKANRYWPFSLTSDGSLLATKANITGTITAEKGKIADYVISGAQLIGNNVGMSGTSGQGWAFWAGSNDAGSAPFRVGHDGSFRASVGTIGGWNISTNYLQGTWVGSNGKTNYVKIKVPDDTTDTTFLDVKYNETFPFVVTKTGHLTATDATIAGWNINSNSISKGSTVLSASSSNGELTCYNGIIGGWNLGANSLTKYKNTTVGTVGIYTDGRASFGNDYGWINTGSAGTWINGNSYTNPVYITDSFKHTQRHDVNSISVEATHGRIYIRSDYNTANTNGSTVDLSSIYLYASNGNIRLKAENSGNTKAYVVINGDYIHLKAETGGKFFGGQWFYGNNEVATTSDLRNKNTITKFSEKYSVAFDLLNPCLFKYNNGTSDRLHSGFIAQNVIEALNQASINLQEFAGVVHKTDENDDLYCLRYSEFIALNTWQIQKLKARVVELEKEIKEIKQNEI